MFIQREVREKFRQLAEVYNIIAVVGTRQVGKTTFLKEQMKGYNASYVLFDDPDVRALFNEDVKKFEKQYIEGYELAVLDEVQYCKDAGPKLKYLAEKGWRIWITSSSEILLGKEVLSYLVGRVSIVRMYPFSLPEFLVAKNQKELNAQIFLRTVWEHSAYGGYPKAVITDSPEIKKTILKDLHDTMILKDVARTFSINDTTSLERLVKYLSANIGDIVVYGTVTQNLNISFQTLKKYLDALQKSYIIVEAPPFHTNKIKEISKQPKIYFLDTGLRNAVAQTFASEPDGKLFENYVFSELVKLGYSPKFWRTKSKVEVDFIVERDSKPIPIEVKLNAEVRKIESNLRAFIEYYKPEKALVVSYRGEEGARKIDNCTVHFTNPMKMRGLLV